MGAAASLLPVAESETVICRQLVEYYHEDPQRGSRVLKATASQLGFSLEKKPLPPQVDRLASSTETVPVEVERSTASGPKDLLTSEEVAFADTHALSLNATSSTLEELSEVLVAPFKDNEAMKLRSIFRWITENISYDLDVYSKGVSPKDCEPSNVLQKRRSVCSGYSQLLSALASHSGIQVKRVSGWARGFASTVGEELTKNQPNHEWNSVSLDGRVFLLDVTWASGYVRGLEFVKHFNNHYWLTPPREFILDHFPADATMQCLEPQVTAKDFDSFPQYLSPAFDCQLTPVTHHRYLVSSNEEEQEMKFELLSKTRVAVKLIDSNGHEVENQTWHETNAIEGVAERSQLQVWVRLPHNASKFTLEIFTKAGSDEGLYALSMVYILERATPQCIQDAGPFPLMFGGYETFGVRLVVPRFRSIMQGDMVQFLLEIEKGINNAVQTTVVLMDSSNRTFHFSNDGKGMFSFRGTLNVVGDVTVLANQDGASTFTGLLGFSVQPSPEKPGIILPE